MKKQKIFGYSDDLIILEGAVCEEVEAYKGIVSFIVSDGTKGSLKFDGLWKIDIVENGTISKNLYASLGDDSPVQHVGDAKGCSTYSDVLVFEGGVEWIKIGGKIFKP